MDDTQAIQLETRYDVPGDAMGVQQLGDFFGRYQFASERCEVRGHMINATEFLTVAIRVWDDDLDDYGEWVAIDPAGRIVREDV